ncbi:MAG: hypothetical protein A2Z47_04360 [Thermodesulfovibrio sp. RBG_19FT_COMBO_42_12]|nr:MAG: hypothetical protein A2Z47_04360 [Thermodesulfovibrio sp. RBG_19FT_COMBO_42_12]
MIAEPESPPEKPILPVEIKIDFKKKEFTFTVDGTLYKFKDWKDSKRDKNIFDELKPGLRIGFLNEVGPVSLSNISIT